MKLNSPQLVDTTYGVVKIEGSDSTPIVTLWDRGLTKRQAVELAQSYEGEATFQAVRLNTFAGEL